MQQSKSHTNTNLNNNNNKPNQVENNVILEERGRLLNSTSSQQQQQQQIRDHSLDGFTLQSNNNNNNNINKPMKPKTGTSHVVCKFYKQGACQVGSSCPFSHESSTPGSKAICQWYTTGNCKFGHKCALAHLLPGQPMSYDRKNKRAAQAALRDAQSGGGGGGGQILVPLSPRPQHQQSPQLQHQQLISSISGIGRSLGNSGPGSPKNQSNNNGGNGNLENRAPSSPKMNGSPRLMSNGNSPTIKANSITLSTSIPPTIIEGLSIISSSPSFENTLSRSNNSNKIAPSYAYPNPNSNPSGLSQTLNSQFSPKGGNLAHVMLGQHGRRLSNNNQISNNNGNISSSSLSPPRMTPRKSTGYTASELLEASPSGSSSSPLALPTVVSSNGNSIFGTSPFSASKGLFMPSSYDSSDGDAFGRSPPGGSRGLEEMRRSNSNSGWDRPAMLGFNPDDSSAVGDEEESEDEYDEGFLPSSLNDLLTPEEKMRRGSRISNTSGFNPFQQNYSSSVPAELMLSNGRPIIPTTSSNSYLSPPPPQSRSLLSNSSFPINSPPRMNNDFLSISPQARNIYSSSYDPSTISHQYQQQQQQQQTSSSLLSNYFSPTSTANSVLPPLSPSLGSSLPGELAAGFNHLHLTPASNMAGDPPVQLISFLGPLPTSNTNDTSPGSGSKLNAWGIGNSTSPSSWGSSIPNKGLVVGINSSNSPLHQASSVVGLEDQESGEDDEIQFDMDT